MAEGIQRNTVGKEEVFTTSTTQASCTPASLRVNASGASPVCQARLIASTRDESVNVRVMIPDLSL